MMYQRATLLVIVVMLICITLVPAAASETNWRWQANVGYEAGYADKYAQVGTAAGASDGIGPEDGVLAGPNAQFDDSYIYCAIGGQLLARDIKAPITAPTPRKTWNFVIGANPGYNQSSISLWWTKVTGYEPVSVINGQEYRYVLRMLDNKGVAGAPANGTTWTLPRPEDYQALVLTPFITLPTLTIPQMTTAEVLASSYRMDFYLEPVPEPASLLALGSGLLALGGSFIRRKK